MLAAVLITGAIAAIMSIALIAIALDARKSYAPALVGRTVVVHTRAPDDKTIRGLLHGQYADRWSLRDAVLVVAEGVEQPLGGLQHIPVENISWSQEIQPA